MSKVYALLPNGKEITHCYQNCTFFHLDGGPGPVMCCTHPECPVVAGAPKGYIISHPECQTGFPDLCPLTKRVEEADRKAHYLVMKRADMKPNMDLLISTIKKYVQNNALYFSYMPNFIDGVLIFGIIGTQTEHGKLQDVLSGDLFTLGCTLAWQYSDSMGETHTKIME